MAQGHGANWCNGDCHWSEETCVLKPVNPAATRCGPRASQPSVSSWSSMGHRVRMKFNTVSGSGGSSGSHQRKFVVNVNASLEECGGHFQGTQGVITRSGILYNNSCFFGVYSKAREAVPMKKSHYTHYILQAQYICNSIQARRSW